MAGIQNSDCREFGITATLKPHQVEGVSWRIHKYLFCINVVLGDEMGLGKTLHAISFLSYLKFRQGLGGPSLEKMRSASYVSLISLINMFSKTNSDVRWVNVCLIFTVVLCPLSVMDGWMSEINRFTPKLEVLRYAGDKESRRGLRKTMHNHVNKSSKILSCWFCYSCTP